MAPPTTPPSADDSDSLPDFHSWTPDAQARALDALRTRAEHLDAYRPFYCGTPGCAGTPHGDWNWPHARAEQTPPPLAEDWFCFLMLGGRGSGKTRAGAEYTHRMTKIAPHLALVGPTGPDIREYMVEGVSGILPTAAPGNRPEWEPSKHKLTWPNGAIGHTYSAEEPDRLRGPQHHFAWIDEPAHMPLITSVWDNMLFGLRLGKYPRVIATTTPLPIGWLKALIADPLTTTRRFSTYANIANLAPTFARTILNKYEGTRLGRQELHAEILTDVEGALWSWDLIDNHRVEHAPELVRIVVGIDPAGSANRKADETGIIVAGIDDEEHLYVLADGSGRYTPGRWAHTAMALAEHWAADALVPEKNYGGDMVTHTLKSQGADLRIKPVTSRRGKIIRAEPIVSLYEQGKVHHVGVFEHLEDQLTGWVPPAQSPDRLDALVHAATELVKPSRPVQISSPTKLRLVVNR